MTTVGKILVVLHLVLSILFMAFAGAVFTAQKNWRDVAMTAQGNLAKANSKLNDQKTAFDTEKTSMSTKIAELTNQITTLTGEKAALTTQSLELDKDNKRLTLALDNVKDQTLLNGVEAEERAREATQQRAQNSIAFANREDIIKKLHEVEDKRFALEVQMQQLIERHDRVLADLITFKKYNGSKGYPTDPKLMIAQSTPAPPVDGLIVDYRKGVKDKSELVEISLGSDDGLSVGHSMTVYNGAKGYLGKIRLNHVEADKAVGVVTEKAKNQIIQKGDNVTTKL